MPEYGIIENNKLRLVPEQAPGAKRVHYAPFPEFDETTQFLSFGELVEGEETILVHYAVGNLTADEETEEAEAPDAEFVEHEPWVDPGVKKELNEMELLKVQNLALSDRAEFIEELIFEMAMQVYQ